jgi:hypothetical protein
MGLMAFNALGPLTVKVDGYAVGDRLLEGVMFTVTFEPVSWTEVRVIDVQPVANAESYLADLNRQKWIDAIRQHALDSPDEEITDAEHDTLEAEWGERSAPAGITIPVQTVDQAFKRG